MVLSSADNELLTRLTAWCAEQGLVPPEDVTGCPAMIDVFLEKDTTGGTITVLRQHLTAIRAEVSTARAELETARESGEAVAAADSRTGALGEIAVYQERGYLHYL